MIQYKLQPVGFFSAKKEKMKVCPVQGKTFCIKEIAREIEETMGIPAIRTMGVLAAFVETAYKHLENGEPVLLDDFATFKPGLTLEDDTVVVKKINLLASVEMKERLKAFQIQETED